MAVAYVNLNLVIMMEIMKKDNLFRFALVFGSAAAAFSMTFGGCSVLPNEVRYDDKTISYSTSSQSGSRDNMAGTPSVKKGNIGQYDDATAYYVARRGSGSKFPDANVLIPQPVPEYYPQEKNLVVLAASDILFDFDKAVIKSAYAPELNKWADFFMQNPEKTANIYGHTDSVGTEKYNQGLSLRRARAVVKYLVDRGVAPERLSAKGFGESRPATSNDTKEGRQQNRRVEVEY